MQDSAFGNDIFDCRVIRSASLAVTAFMSHLIIVKLELNEKNELVARNFDRRYEQSIAMTDEIVRIFGRRTIVFAEARLTGSGQLIVLRRARDRLW